MQGGAKPPGPLAFEPIAPPKRQIVDSHRRRPSRHCGGGRSVTGEGGRLCTYKLGSDYELADGGSGRRSADSTIFAASGSPVSRPCAPASLPRQVRTLGEHLMHGLRYRILAGTALALILAVPMVGLAQGPNKLAPAPTTASPPAALSVEQTATPAPAPSAAAPVEQAATPAPAAATPAEQASTPALAADPVAMTEQAAPADPLASLDPRPCNRGKGPRPPGRDLGQDFCQQKRACSSRGVLPEPQLPAAVARQRRRERACHLRHRSLEARRCRWARGQRL